MSYKKDGKYDPCRDCHCLASCDNCFFGDTMRAIHETFKAVDFERDPKEVWDAACKGKTVLVMQHKAYIDAGLVDPNE